MDIDVSDVSTRCALHSVMVLKIESISINTNTYAFWTLYININNTELLRELVRCCKGFHVTVTEYP